MRRRGFCRRGAMRERNEHWRRYASIGKRKKETDRKRDRQTERQTERQTDRELPGCPALSVSTRNNLANKFDRFLIILLLSPPWQR
jgi:hypothetical protein